MHFLQAPAEAVVLWAAAGDVALVAPQARQLFQALLQAAIPQLLSVLFRLVLSLLVEQLLQRLLGQAGAHRVQQAEREAATPIGEPFTPAFGEAPAIAGAPRPAGCGAGFSKTLLREAAQMTPYHLNGEIQGARQVSCLRIPALQKQGQQGIAGAGLSRGGHGRGNLITRCHWKGSAGVHNGGPPWGDRLP